MKVFLIFYDEFCNEQKKKWKFCILLASNSKPLVGLSSALLELKFFLRRMPEDSH
jgi:hypothetical protein